MRSENGEPLRGTDSDARDGETMEPQALAGEGKEEDLREGTSAPADDTSVGRERLAPRETNDRRN